MYNNKKIFYVNSRDRTSGTDSDFTCVLDIKPDDNFDCVAVLQANIPKTYYLVQANDNTFILDEITDIATITMPPGNYSRKSFATVLQDQLNASSPNNFNYSIDFPKASETDTGKYTFTVTGNDITQPSFIFTTHLFEQMGFDQNSTNTFTANTLISNNVIKLQAEDTIFLHSNICQNATSDNILQEFYANTGEPAYSMIHFENYNIDAYCKPMVSSTNQVYRFYLTNEGTTPLDLNGLNLVFTLVCFKKNQVYNVVSDFIDLMTWKMRQEASFN